MERLALPADDPRIGRHRSCEVYLVFERHGGKAWLERSYEGCCNTGIEQDGRVATMDESQGIVVLCRRYRGQHDEPRLGSLDVDIEKLEHRRTRNGTLHERSEVLKTRESGNALVCGRIHTLSLQLVRARSSPYSSALAPDGVSVSFAVWEPGSNPHREIRVHLA